MKTFTKPTEVSDLDVAFPSNVETLMPAYEEIPVEFRNGRNKWNQFFGDMFYFGVKDLELSPNEGIDPKVAMRHIRAISGSFQPAHEHKEAAVAYLMSLWFKDVKYVRSKG